MSTPMPSDGVRPRRPPLPPPNPNAEPINFPSPPPSPTASYSDREDGQLGKKRKTPSSMQCGRADNSWDRHTNHTCNQHSTDSEGGNLSVESPFKRKDGKWILNYYHAKSKAAKAGSWKRALYLRRKAALITLFLDAQNVVTNELKKGIERNNLILPEVAVFEKMLPALEHIGVGDWAMDNPGWRTGGQVGVEQRKESVGVLEHWRTKSEKRRRIAQGRKVVARGGWAPEGSFEFEQQSEASNWLRTSAKHQTALAKLAVVLRTITLSTVKPTTTTTTISTRADEHEMKRAQPSTHQPRAEPAKILPQLNNAPKFDKDASKDSSVAMSKTNSSQGSETASGKKKPKKKKRSVLANQSNPHHVDNYRPTRLIGALGDPYEPYASHANLLFPPPMRFLATRPKTRSPGPAGQPQPMRPSEEDYICTFCEYTLFYGSEEARKRAIRARRRELKRKQTIKNRAKNVADGKGKGNLGREDEDWDEEGEGEEGRTGCHGRCSCGRPLSGGGKGKVKKPPDPGEDDDYDHHHDHHDHHEHHDHEHDHDHDHNHGHHDHDHDHHDHHHKHEHSHPSDHHEHNHHHDHSHNGQHQESYLAPSQEPSAASLNNYYPTWPELSTMNSHTASHLPPSASLADLD